MSTDCLAGARGNRWLDGGNLAVANGYVKFRGNIVFRIEDLAVAKNEIVLLSVCSDSTGEESGGQNAKHWLGVYPSIAMTYLRFRPADQVDRSQPASLAARIARLPIILREVTGQCQQLFGRSGAKAGDEAVPQNHQRNQGEQVG